MNDYIEFDGEKINIPDAALGNNVPHYLERLKQEEALREKAERKADLYFIFGLLSTLAGTILGWALEKFF